MVIHDLLLKSPPGELYVVLEGGKDGNENDGVEIKDLLPGCDLPQDFVESTLKEYNLTNHVLADMKDSQKHLVLVGSQDDASNVYYDVFEKRAYQFDHANNEIVNETEYRDEGVTEERIGELRDSLIQECRNYIKSRFCADSGAS